MSKLKKGYIQVYMGDGKGKTTAAFGLALRALGYGLKVFIAQFIKEGEYNEIKALKLLGENIVIKQYGSGFFIRNKPKEEEVKLAKNGLKELKDIIKSEKYDLLILDEINVALYFKLISLEDILDIVCTKPDHTEMVFTGRKVAKEIVELADLVTEMREIKHYYSSGIQARNGIEK